MPNEKLPINPADAPTIDEIVGADNATYIVPSKNNTKGVYHMTPTEVRDGLVVFGGKSAGGMGDEVYKSMTIGDYLNNRERLPRVIREELGADALRLAEEEGSNAPELSQDQRSQDQVVDSLSDGHIDEIGIEEDPRPKVLTEQQRAELQAAWSEAFSRVDTGVADLQRFFDGLEGRGMPVGLKELIDTLVRHQPDHTLIEFRSSILKARTVNSDDEWLRKLLYTVDSINIQPNIGQSLQYSRSKYDAAATLHNAITYIKHQRDTIKALLKE